MKKYLMICLMLLASQAVNARPYIGLHLGHGASTTKHTSQSTTNNAGTLEPILTPGSTSLGGTAPAVGATAGYEILINDFTAAAEVSYFISHMKIVSSSNHALNPIKEQMTLSRNGYFRPSVVVGYNLDENHKVFVRLGVKISKWTFSDSVSGHFDTLNKAHASKVHFNISPGFGIEKAIDDTTSVRVEYALELGRSIIAKNANAEYAHSYSKANRIHTNSYKIGLIHKF